jgi:hypothetical protein
MSADKLKTRKKQINSYFIDCLFALTEIYSNILRYIK